MERFLIKRLIMPVLFLLVGYVVFGQQVSITGRVTDAEDGSSIPGVSIAIKGTSGGTVTRLNGEYSLMAKPGDVLVFGFIGFEPQEITVGNQTTINVALVVDVMSILDEVVVIGYGTVRKEDATGSVQTITSEFFNPGIMSSPEAMVMGKMAGVQITSGGGAPGEGSTIRIRGGSSLLASNDPLIVIDGIAVETGGPAGVRNPLSTINANDIETFTVLKDASATAIYGSRASNGVIIITTKKGVAGAPFTVNYTGSVSASLPISYVDVFSPAEYRDLIATKYSANASAQALLGGSNTDWQKEIYQTAIAHDHNLSFSGGLSVLPYRVSLGYTNQDGILKTDNLNRFIGSVNLNPSFLDDHLKLEVNVKGMLIDNTFANRGAIGGAVSMDPTQATDFLWMNPDNTPLFVAPMNPLTQLNDRTDVSTVGRLLGNVMLEYKMHFFPALKAKLNLSADRSSSEGALRIPVGSFLSYDIYQGNGQVRDYTQNKANSLLDFYFDYTGEFGGHSRINAIAGYEWQHFFREGATIDKSFNGLNTYEDTDYKSESYLVSFFGRVNYVLYDRYLMTLTLRNDGSSRFAPESRWGLFPSVAFAWNIAREEFFNFEPVSILKLRLGYGITGQQNLGDNDYPYQPSYTFAEAGAYYQFGNRYIQTARAGGYDSKLKWEETETFNMGLDFGLLSNRITGDVDIYLRKTSDLINMIPVPAGTNLTNQIVTNVGDMENKGVEFTINGNVLNTPDFDWELGVNMGYNVNTITKLTKVDDEDYKGIYVGGISGGVGNNIQIHSIGHPAYTFYVQEQVYGSNGKPIEGLYVDRNNDGSITGDDRYWYQQPAATVSIGFTSLMRYKSFDFTFNGRVNLGNYIYNNVKSNYGAYAGMVASGYLSNRNKDVSQTNFENSQYYSDYYMENGSFMKLDNISIGYSMTNLFQEKLNMRVYTTAQNLVTVTKYSGLDPEVFGGIDNNIYPRPRIFLLGISLTY
jgi:TonB-dependent starch-binding outer membrane protein SusC